MIITPADDFSQHGSGFGKINILDEKQYDGISILFNSIVMIARKGPIKVLGIMDNPSLLAFCIC